MLSHVARVVLLKILDVNQFSRQLRGTGHVSSCKAWDDSRIIYGGMKRLFLVGALVSATVLAVIFVASKVRWVDPKPAIALGEQYFSRLRSGQLEGALALYTDEFRRKYGADWQKLISSLNTNYGTVTGFTLLENKVVPLTSPAGEIPCVSVRYHVARSAFPIEETLLVCPQPNTQMAIVGHQLTRLDTGQTIAAGATVKEYELFSIGAKPNVATQTDFEIARKAADELYRRVSDEDYGAIWDAAHDDFKRSISRDQFMGAMRQWNERLGVCRTPELADTDYVNKSGERFVGLIYSRECEHGTIREKLAWKIVGGAALLRGYH